VPAEDYCCEECFRHAWLRATVRENLTERGRCYYCGIEGLLAPVQVLCAGFTNLLSDYIPAKFANGGRDDYFPSVPVFDAIQRDWLLFSDEFIPKARSTFLPSVFKGNSLPENFEDFTIPAVAFHRNAMSTIYGKWQDFVSIDDQQFTEWASRHSESDIETPGTFINSAQGHLQSFVRHLAPGLRLWRARANYLGSPYDWQHLLRPLPVNEMGMNPTHPASRLNRDGEAVLYCAESEKTAISEIRPARGYFCTTCELSLTRDIQVLDFAQTEEINPFTSGPLSWILDLRRTSRMLSWVIAKPISRGDDIAVYARTQLIGFIARKMNIQGIRFSSSLDSPHGVNLALFDSCVVIFSSPRLVEVTETQLQFRGINSDATG
jgi:hypothetical protein